MGLQPKTATLFRNGTEVVVPIDDVKTGDIVLMKPGEKFRWMGLFQKELLPLTKA